jgi:threonine synthase
VNSAPEGAWIVCGGCGAIPDAADPFPFICPNAGDGGDHVLRRRLDLKSLTFPQDDPEPNPFVRYRRFLYSYSLARAHGMTDEAYVFLVRRLNDRVALVDGRGFSVTPFAPAAALGVRVGLSAPVWVKDETGNVAGSHKARHFFGLLIYLEVVERVGLVSAGVMPQLAVASCGNAALAAATLAAAGGRRLQVFVPTEADARIVARLRELGAEVSVCPRRDDGRGDPAEAALRDALAAGSLPFTCQGSHNGLVIEGGETIGYEMAAQLASAGTALDDVVVQVGGGALASALAGAFEEAVGLDVLPRRPRLHTVQTDGAWPLKRALDRIIARVPAWTRSSCLGDVLAEIARDRSSYMWPWETTPHSMAVGLLDDETYDWLAVVEAMLATGGHAVVAGEDALAWANAVARDTGIPVDPTGSAGLAGLRQLRQQGSLGIDARVGIIFTGGDARS